MIIKKLIITLSIAALAILWGYKNNTAVSVLKDEYEEPYALLYDTGNGSININILKGEAGESYLFLPSGSDCEKIRDTVNKKTGREIIDFSSNRDVAKNDLIVLSGEGVPSVFIKSDTTYEEFSEDKEVKREAEIAVYDESLRCLDRERIEIKGHGQSSWKAEKKSIRLIFEEPLCILGLAEGREFVAVNNTDESHMRNKVCENMGKVLEMEYVPSSVYINLYYNGEYLGLYMLYEKVAPGEKRVDISTSKGLSKGEIRMLDYTDDEDLKGYIYPEGVEEVRDKGIILKEEPIGRFANVTTGFVNDEKYQMEVVYPKYASTDYIEEIKTYLHTIYKAMETPDGTVQVDGVTKHYSGMIDVYSFAARYLVEQVSKNKDGTRCSSYYYIKNYDGMDSILFAGPLWDYNIAFGEHYRNHMYTYPYGIIPLRPGLYERDDFMAYVIELYKGKLRGYMQDGVFGDIDETAAAIRDSVNMDSVRWGKNPERFETEVERLKNFINVRNWDLDKTWLENSPPKRINFVKDGNIAHSVYCYDGESIESAIGWQPFPEESAGTLWYEEDEETPADLSISPAEDMAFWAKE